MRPLHAHAVNVVRLSRAGGRLWRAAVFALTIHYSFVDNASISCANAS